MFLSSQSRIVRDAHRSDVRCDALHMRFARRRHAITRRTQLHHSWRQDRRTQPCARILRTRPRSRAAPRATNRQRRRSDGNEEEGRQQAKRGAAKKGAAARKGAAKKSSARGSTSRSAAKRSAAKKGGAKKSTAKRSPVRRKTSPLDRVKRVATGVVEQAQTAVSHGVDAVKELGENIVERVSG
jgi:hypothetical protein